MADSSSGAGLTPLFVPGQRTRSKPTITRTGSPYVPPQGTPAQQTAAAVKYSTGQSPYPESTARTGGFGARPQASGNPIFTRTPTATTSALIRSGLTRIAKTSVRASRAVSRGKVGALYDPSGMFSTYLTQSASLQARGLETTLRKRPARALLTRNSMEAVGRASDRQRKRPAARLLTRSSMEAVGRAAARTAARQAVSAFGKLAGPRGFGRQKTTPHRVSSGRADSSRAIPELRVPSASRYLSSAKLEAKIAKENAAAQAKGARQLARAQHAQAVAAAKAQRATERAIALQNKTAQKAADHAAKVLAKADEKLKDIQDKAAEKYEKQVQKLEKAQLKIAEKTNPRLIDDLTRLAKERLGLPNTATVMQLATGQPTPGADPKAIERQQRCRDRANKAAERLKQKCECQQP